MRSTRLLIILLISMSCLSLKAEQLTDSVRVHFRVNQTEIDTLLMGNNQSLRGFLQRLCLDVDEFNRLKKEDSKQINDSTNKQLNTIRLNRIVITGAASPEGSIAVNERLSRERAAAITRWLQGYFEFPDTLPQFIFKGRDWQGLLMAVIGDPDVPNKKEVIDLLRDIVGTHHGASAPTTPSKRDGVARLKALRGGVPYRYLLTRHFPGLRASEVFIEATLTRPDIMSQVSDKLDMAAQSDPSDLSDPSDMSDPSDSSDLSDMSDSSDPSDMADSSGHRGFCMGIKSNLLYDVLATPNLGAEFSLGKHFSVGANWMYAWWQNRERNRHWRIYGGDINARYYFGNKENRPLTGHHIGVYGQVLVFQIAFGGKGYITGIPGENLWGKPYLGGGIEYGYSKRIGKRLNIDFSLGLGYMAGEYRVYRPIDDHYVWQSSHRRNWIGPTKAEISLVWLIGKMPSNERKEVSHEK